MEMRVGMGIRWEVVQLVRAAAKAVAKVVVAMVGVEARVVVAVWVVAVWDTAVAEKEKVEAEMEMVVEAMEEETVKEVRVVAMMGMVQAATGVVVPVVVRWAAQN